MQFPIYPMETGWDLDVAPYFKNDNNNAPTSLFIETVQTVGVSYRYMQGTKLYFEKANVGSFIKLRIYGQNSAGTTRPNHVLLTVYYNRPTL